MCTVRENIFLPNLGHVFFSGTQIALWGQSLSISKPSWEPLASPLAQLPQRHLIPFSILGESNPVQRNGRGVDTAPLPPLLPLSFLSAPNPNPSFLSIEVKVTNSWGRRGGTLCGHNVCAPDQHQIASSILSLASKGQTDLRLLLRVRE